jgi:hypothetical protein
MGRVTLLELARAAGLSVSSKAGRLVIKGPRSADALARELIGRKAEVLGLLDELAPEQSPPAPAPLTCRNDELGGPVHWRITDEDTFFGYTLTPMGHTEPVRWRCLSRYCRDGSRWWRSRWNVVICENCVPPSLPGLVAARGDRTNAPLVDPDHSNQAIGRLSRSQPGGTS